MFRMLNPNDIQAEPGDVLINGAACFPDFEELKCSVDIIRFLDFCVGLDAAVLHNTLHSVGMSIGAVNPVLMTLMDAGFVQEYDALYPPDTQAIGNFRNMAKTNELLQRVTKHFSSQRIGPSRSSR